MLTGANGVGKSTLALTLAGLLPPVGGSVEALPLLAQGLAPDPGRWRSKQRITRVGWMLRATRIDELPQLASIVAGDMSLIGPRPLPPAVLAQAADGGVLRSRIKPGLTGWAQVNGNARLNDRDKLALDAWYVGHRSAWLDLVIVARTLRVIVMGESVDEGAIRKAHAMVGAHELEAPCVRY